MAPVTVTCYSINAKKNYRTIANAMSEGIRACGDETVLTRHLSYRQAQVGVMYGWQFNAMLRRHPKFLYADLGYWRRGCYWRFAANAWSPSSGMARGMQSDRFAALGIEVLPEHSGAYVLVLGASQKSSAQHGFGYMRWEMKVCEKLLGLGARVLFRPKPKDVHARSIRGTTHASRGPVEALFADASLVVAHHSNACLEAVAAGCAVHCVTGIAAERSVPLETWCDPPRLPGREQFLADAAYTQWTVDEMRSGEAWRHMRAGVLR